MKRLIACCMAACIFLLGFAACSSSPNSQPESTSSGNPDTAGGDSAAHTTSFSYVNKDLSPQTLTEMIDQIYADCDVQMIEEPDETTRTERFYLPDELFEECYIRYCANRYGLADLTIVKPAAEKEEDVWQALTKRLQDRRNEFKNYDIHNSFAIAKAGEVFEVGNYLVMVIFEENAPVKETLQNTILA